MSASAASPYITAHTNDPRGLVCQYRANEIAVRRLTFGPGANAATWNALDRRKTARGLVESSLVVANFAVLAGWLVEERKVNYRLARARWLASVGTRPELIKRRTAARKAIKAELRRLGK